MQIRKVPIVLSLLATLTLLFGGWFLYQKMEIEEPVRNEIEQMKSANLADLEVGKEQLNIQLTVTNPDKFPVEYQELLNTLQKRVQNKQVRVEVTNQDQQLKEIWTNGVFVFTEAVDLHQYSRIPQMLANWKQDYQLDAASTQMDDDNIYIYLKRGSADFYAMVPRNPVEEVTDRG